VNQEIPAEQWTTHGGRVDLAREAFPEAPLPWLDLSTGINPHRWPVPEELAMADAGALPAPSDLAALERTAAAALGASGAVAALPGSEIGIRMLQAIGMPGPNRHVSPGYASHAAAFHDSWAIPVTDIDAAAASGGTIILANPANPDGHLLEPEHLVAVARRMRRRGGWLIVDEAFADTMPEASVLPHLQPDDPVLVFRSFGKFFGLAGIRLGFAIGPEQIIERIRARLGGWPVSSLALAVGRAAYADAGWIAAMRARLRGEAAALDAVLARAGLAPRGACPLFRLIETEEAGALFPRLARAGILTRPFDHTPRWLRIGLPGDAEGLARLERALSDG